MIKYDVTCNYRMYNRDCKASSIIMQVMTAITNQNIAESENSACSIYNNWVFVGSAWLQVTK